MLTRVIAPKVEDTDDVPEAVLAIAFPSPIIDEALLLPLMYRVLPPPDSLASSKLI